MLDPGHVSQTPRGPTLRTTVQGYTHTHVQTYGSNACLWHEAPPGVIGPDYSILANVWKVIIFEGTFSSIFFVVLAAKSSD